MAGIAFGADADSPDIVFLHATGFNARTYRMLLQPLGERFSVVALDMRGHGRTTLPAPVFGYTSWQRHRDDVLAVIERNFMRPLTLAGHSMGATVGLLAAGKRPDLIAGLALLEPVILPAGGYALMQVPGWPLLQRLTMPFARTAARRRVRFPDRESAVRAFAGRGIFNAFPPEVIADYVGDGLIEDVRAGDFKLACRPVYEAATYCAHRNDPWAALKSVRGPLVVLRADHNATSHPNALQRIVAVKPDARVATVEGASHMLPIERPDRARAAIETAALISSPYRRVED